MNWIPIDLSLFLFERSLSVIDSFHLLRISELDLMGKLVKVTHVILTKVLLLWMILFCLFQQLIYTDGKKFLVYVFTLRIMCDLLTDHDHLNQTCLILLNSVCTYKQALSCTHFSVYCLHSLWFFSLRFQGTKFGYSHEEVVARNKSIYVLHTKWVHLFSAASAYMKVFKIIWVFIDP